jgi:hypothetical protein
MKRFLCLSRLLLGLIWLWTPVAQAAESVPTGAIAAATDSPCVWTNVRRIVAIGDVHGDAAKFLRCLRMAGVVDTNGQWIAGDTHLVQTGDVMGRGRATRRVLDTLMALEPQAARAGGRVHMLLGNHEARVLAGQRWAVPDADMEAYGGREVFIESFAPNGRYGRWLLARHAIVRINDTLFMHGGLSAAYTNRPLKELNAAIRAELRAGRSDGPAGDDEGPLWYRGLAEDPEAEVALALAPALRAHDARRVVIGHTVTAGGVAVRAGGRVLMIDVGMSDYHVGRPPACLLLEGGRAFAVTEAGRKELATDGGGGSR